MTVDEISPPKMTMASGFRSSFPGSPPAKMSGIKANAVTSEVIRTGTTRSSVARITISLVNAPSDRTRDSDLPISMMPLRDTMPASEMNPTRCARFMTPPVNHTPIIPPMNTVGMFNMICNTMETSLNALYSTEKISIRPIKKNIDKRLVFSFWLL